MKPLLALALLTAAAPTLAQSRNELAMQVGFTSSSEFDQKTPGIQTLELESGFATWNFTAGRFFSSRFGVEVSFADQDAAIVIGTSAGSAELFDVTLQQLHANAVYAFAKDGRRLTPFVFAGLGAAFLDASELNGETKLTWDVGAGLKWFPGRTFGLRAQVRYNPTRLNDESSDVCDPFGFCQDAFRQFELAGGVSIRF